MADDGKQGLGASFGAARALPAKIEVQQVKASVRARLFGIKADAPRLGDYSVTRRIGRGGMGAVYEAVGPGGEVVALKTLRGFSPAMLYHLKQEFRALAGVAHPNLVGLHKLYVRGKQAFFTMELVEGVDLIRYVRRDLAVGTLDEEVIARLRAVLRQIVDAVAALHRVGKLHRDLKPSNVLVDADGRAVVLDFGLVRDIAEVSGLTSSNESFVGTPAYMAPELAAGESLSEVGDWYAVGVILFEALTGALPFTGGGFQVLLEKCQAPAPAVASRVEGAPEDLAALCARLLERRPEARAGLAELREILGVPAGGAAPNVAPVDGLLGRSDELARLGGALARVAAEARPRVVALSGESGIGKSALLLRFAELAQRESGAIVLSGRCYISESVPFRALDPVIDALTRVLLDLPPDEAAALLPEDSAPMARLFPVLGRVKGLADAAEGEVLVGEAPAIQRRAFAALRRLVANLARRRPLVIVIDDLQWGDDDSALLLRELLAGPGAPRLLTVLGVRSDDPVGERCIVALREADGAPALERMRLGPLADDDARTLVRGLVGGDVDDARVDAIVREAAGSPLFLVELARLLDERGRTCRGGGIEDVIRARLRGLPSLALRLLEVLAVASRPLAPTVAIEAAEAGSAARSLLPALRANNLVREVAGEVVELELLHDRIREEILASLSAGQRQELHRNLAVALTKAGGGPELLALHYRLAGLHVEALQHTLAAGEEAMAALAFRRAAGFFTAALELTEAAATRRAIHSRLAEALVDLGCGAEAAEHYFAAAEGADAPESLALRRSAALMLLRSGVAGRGIATLREVLADVGEPWPSEGKLALVTLTAERMRNRIRGIRYRLRPPEAISRSTLDHLDALAAAREGLSSIHPVLGMIFQGRFLRLAMASGEPNRLVEALAGEAAFIAHLGGGERVSRYLDEARALLARCDDPRAEESWELCSGVVAFSRGRWRACFEHMDAVRRLGLRHQGSRYIATMRAHFELNALFFLGELRLLRERRPLYLQQVDEAGDLCGSTTLRAGLQSFALLADDAWQEARDELSAAVQRWPGQHFVVQRAWAYLGQRAVDLYADPPAHAWAQHEREWPFYRRNVVFAGPYLRIMGRLWRANTALAAAAAGQRRLLDEVADELRHIAGERAPWARPLVALLRGGLSSVVGEGSRVAGAYSEAALGFDEHAMPLWAAAARWRLGQHLGGERGRALVAAARQRFIEQGVVAPARLMATLAPGVR